MVVMLACPMICWSIFGGYPAWIISAAAVTAPARASRAVLPRRAILPPRKDHQQGRSGLRPPRRVLRKRRPVPDDLARQAWRLSEGRGERRDQPWRGAGHPR